MRLLLLMLFTVLLLTGNAQKHFLSLELNGGNSLEVRRVKVYSPFHGVIALSEKSEKVRELIFGFGLGYAYYGELLALKTNFSFRNTNVITGYVGGSEYRHFLYSQMISLNVLNTKSNIFLGPLVSLGLTDMYQRSIYNFFIPGVGVLFKLKNIELSYKYEYVRPIPFFWANYCSDNECHLSFSQLSFSYLIGFKKKE